MSKGTSIRISIFALASTIICIIGNLILHLNLLLYTCQGLGFLSYLFLLIWVSQIIYEKAKFRINVIILVMSFSLAAYSLALFSLLPYEEIFEYYVLFFYLFSLICIFGSIVLVGRIIFYSPKSSKNDVPVSNEKTNNENCEQGKEESYE